MTYVLSLVHAWLLENPEHTKIWVEHYTQLRTLGGITRLVTVGGHYRAKDRRLAALCCVAKFERIVKSVRPKVYKHNVHKTWVWV